MFFHLYLLFYSFHNKQFPPLLKNFSYETHFNHEIQYFFFMSTLKEYLGKFLFFFFFLKNYHSFLGTVLMVKLSQQVKVLNLRLIIILAK